MKAYFTKDVFCEKTSGERINTTWLAVAANRTLFTPFVEWVVPQETVVFLAHFIQLRMKLYETGGAEFKTGDLMLTYLRPQDKQPIEIGELECSLEDFASTSWVEQRNKEIMEAFVVTLPKVDSGLNVFYAKPGWKIQLSIKRNDVAVPAAAHASTLLEFPYYIIDLGIARNLRDRAMLGLAIEKQVL